MIADKFKPQQVAEEINEIEEDQADEEIEKDRL